MYRWIVARIARWAILSGVNGKPELATRMMADDVTFEFPGSSSFGRRCVAGTRCWPGCGGSRR